MKNNTINKKEIEKFSRIAEEWWNPDGKFKPCLLYTSPSPRDQRGSRMPSSA